MKNIVTGIVVGIMAVSTVSCSACNEETTSKTDNKETASVTVLEKEETSVVISEVEIETAEESKEAKETKKDSKKDVKEEDKTKEDSDKKKEKADTEKEGQETSDTKEAETTKSADKTAETTKKANEKAHQTQKTNTATTRQAQRVVSTMVRQTTRQTTRQTSYQPKQTTKQTSAPTQHMHKWKAVYKTVNIPEKGHWEKILIREARTEKYPNYDYVAYMYFPADGYKAYTQDEVYLHGEYLLENNMSASWRTEYEEVIVSYDTVNYPAEYEDKYVIDQAASTQQVLDYYVCTSCGARK